MIRNGIYSAATKKEKPVARILATVFGILVGLLLIFIVWSAVTFGDSKDAVFVPQAQEISELKIQVQTQTQTIDALRSEIADLKVQLEEEKKKNASLTKPEEPPADEIEQPLSGENVETDE